MYSVYFFLFFFFIQLNIQTTVAQTEQTEPLDLSVLKEMTDERKQHVVWKKKLWMERYIDECTGEELPESSRCNESSSQSADSRVHLAIHTNKKRHSCSECGKRFAKLSDLKDHLMIHTGEKPHSCSECGKSFAKLSNLKSHMRRMHAHEKPFNCSICLRSFSQKHHMRRHMRIHSIEKCR